MDKVYTKIVLDRAEISQAKSAYIKKTEDGYIFVHKNFEEEKCTLDKICDILEKELKYPMFIKPSNSGSSVGISRAETKEELKNGLEYASQFDRKILVEQGIIGKELECAVLGNDKPIASSVGEVKSADTFYSYDAKYNNIGSETIIPADIPKEKQDEIREIAIKAFKAIDGSGLSRVDFFLEEKTEKVYLNEINTLPGFTTISMYPKLFENVRNKL